MLDFAKDYKVIAVGLFTTSSATAPRDTARPEAVNFFNGCILMPIEGPMAFRPALIIDYGALAGLFTLDPNNPFPAAPGLIRYVILSNTQLINTAVDSIQDNTFVDVIGTKSDASVGTVGTLSSIVAYLKGLVGLTGIISGEMVLIPVFNTTQTTQGASVTLFAISAVGGSKKDIKAGFYLAADAAATFTVSVHKTRAGNLVTLVQDLSKASAALPWTIVTPGAAGWYEYELGDLEEGLQMEFRIAQSAVGAANVLCDAAMTYLD